MAVIIAIIIILAILGVILLQNPEATKTPVAIKIIPSDNPTTITTEPGTPKTYNLEIKNFAFSPSSLTIKKGDKIIWTNQDSVSHTVTSDSGNELDSKLLPKGETYSHAFNTAGTYDYHCTPHPYMKAKIIVE